MSWTQKYQINKDSSLGSGSFGSVCIATRIQDNLQVCVKLIKKKMEFSENVLATQSKSEFEIAEAIIKKPHQNLVQIYDIYYEEINDEYAYIFMEKCEDSLAKFLEKQNINQMSLELIDKLIKDISNGYCELINKHKIIHRDFKPENILYKFENGQPIFKIADFGLGRVINDAAEMTRKVGTNKYQAPEVIDKDDYDNRCDIFSFGIVLFEMITGKVGNESLFKEKKKLNAEKFSIIYQQQLQSLPIQYINLLDKMICWNNNERISWKDLNSWSSQTQSNIPQNNPIQNFQANFIPQQMPQPNFNQPNFFNQQPNQNKQFLFNQALQQQQPQQQNQFIQKQANSQIKNPPQFSAQQNMFPPQNQFKQSTNNNNLQEQNSPKNFQIDTGFQNASNPRFQTISTNPANNFQQEQSFRERKNTGVEFQNTGDLKQTNFTNQFPTTNSNAQQQTMRNSMAGGQIQQNFQNTFIQQFPAQNGQVPFNRVQSQRGFSNQFTQSVQKK